MTRFVFFLHIWKGGERLIFDAISFLFCYIFKEGEEVHLWRDLFFVIYLGRGRGSSLTRFFFFLHIWKGGEVNL